MQIRDADKAICMLFADAFNRIDSSSWITPIGSEVFTQSIFSKNNHFFAAYFPPIFHARRLHIPIVEIDVNTVNLGCSTPAHKGLAPNRRCLRPMIHLDEAHLLHPHIIQCWHLASRMHCPLNNCNKHRKTKATELFDASNLRVTIINIHYTLPHSF